MATNIIAFNRGDNYDFDVTISDASSETGRYILKGDDALYFGVMDPNQPFEEAVIKKKYTAEDIDEEGNLVIRLEPEDTIDVLPGRYYYMVKLKQDHYETYDDVTEHVEKVTTIINKTKFVIYD